MARLYKYFPPKFIYETFIETEIVLLSFLLTLVSTIVCRAAAESRQRLVYDVRTPKPIIIYSHARWNIKRSEGEGLATFTARKIWRKLPERPPRYERTHFISRHSDECFFFFQDLENQPGAATERVQDSESQGRKASTSGRGGAGNFTTRDVLAAGTTANVDVTPALQENKPPELGHYGRGGAGNHRIPELDKREKDRLEAQEKAHRKVVRDVEIGLKEPEKVHLGRGGCE